MNEHETIADIIAEMRGFKRYAASDSSDCRYVAYWLYQTFADRLEAAYKRESESITPKSDPDWKDICAKCKDGDIEPKHCEYYGEPNGCNSPIYGEHPIAEKSSAVGDAAKLREAVIKTQSVIAKCMDILNKIPECGYNGLIDDVADELCGLLEEHIKAALAAPPRNCDRPKCVTSKAAQDVWRKEDGGKTAYHEWLLAAATEKEGGAK